MKILNETITVRDNPQANRFETVVAGHTAVAMYETAPGVITFTHTRVPESLRGKGIANELAKAALAAARERGLQVVPKCTFIAAYMKRHPETQDLLTPEARAQLAESPPAQPGSAVPATPAGDRKQ
jgi:predicted GNAT family acetyltransferase